MDRTDSTPEFQNGNHPWRTWCSPQRLEEKKSLLQFKEHAHITLLQGNPKPRMKEIATGCVPCHLRQKRHTSYHGSACWLRFMSFSYETEEHRQEMLCVEAILVECVSCQLSVGVLILCVWVTTDDERCAPRGEEIFASLRYKERGTPPGGPRAQFVHAARAPKRTTQPQQHEHLQAPRRPTYAW